MEIHQSKGNLRPLPKKLPSNTTLVPNEILFGRQEIIIHPISIEISPLVSNYKNATTSQYNLDLDLCDIIT